MNRITSDNNYIVGALVVAISFISLWKRQRNAIRANLFLGGWLLIALFVLDFTKTIAFFSNGACACFIILFSSIKYEAV